MTKASIRGNLTIFSPDAQAVHQNGIDYVLGETNSFSCHVSPHVFPETHLIVKRELLVSATQQELLCGP